MLFRFTYARCYVCRFFIEYACELLLRAAAYVLLRKALLICRFRYYFHFYMLQRQQRARVYAVARGAAYAERGVFDTPLLLKEALMRSAGARAAIISAA